MLRKIGICDDDRIYGSILKEMVEKKVTGEAEIELFYSGGAFLKAPHAAEFHLAFIDIALGDMDGIETARLLRELNKNVVIVLCSGKHQPTTRCFPLNIYRYIMKYDSKETEEGVTSALSRMEELYKEWSIVVKSRKGVVRIAVKQIMYVSRIRGGSEVFLSPEPGEAPQQIIVKKKLEDFYEELSEIPSSYFGFPHNSYLINAKYVKELRANYIILDNGEEFNVARDRYPQFASLLIQSKGSKYEREDGRLADL